MGIGVSEVDGGVATVQLDRDRTGEQQGDDTWQQSMLQGLDPGVHGGFIVVGEDRHRLLGHDRAAVQRGIHEMVGHSGHGHAVGQGIPDRMGAGERRQQAWVRVDDAARVCGKHERAHQPHVPSQSDRVRPCARQHLRQCRVVTPRDDGRVDPLLRRPRDRRTGTVGEHQHDLATQLPARLATRRGGVQRPQVGAGTRHADGDATVRIGHAIDSSVPSA